MKALILLATAFSVSADSFFCGLSLAVKSKKFSLIVLGIASSVLVLGLCGSLLGKIFGEFLKNYAEIFSGIILVIVALFGLFYKHKENQKISADFYSSIITGLSVGLDGAVGCFTLTCSGFNGLLVAMLITIIHVALLILAVLLAKKLRKKLDNNSKLPSIILLILGLYKIFI